MSATLDTNLALGVAAGYSDVGRPGPVASLANGICSADGTYMSFMNSNGQMVSPAGIAIPVVPQALAGTGALGAVSLLTPTTTIATTGAATATLAAGVNGLRKRLLMITDGGDCVVTITNLEGGTTATFNDANDVLDLEYLNSKWKIIINATVTIA